MKLAPVHFGQVIEKCNLTAMECAQTIRQYPAETSVTFLKPKNENGADVTILTETDAKIFKTAFTSLQLIDDRHVRPWFQTLMSLTGISAPNQLIDWYLQASAQQIDRVHQESQQGVDAEFVHIFQLALFLAAKPPKNSKLN